MNKNLRRFYCASLALCMLAATSCGGSEEKTYYSVNNYVYEKQSENLVHFSSTDGDFDFFLNDYFKRHAGGIYENGLNQKVISAEPGLTSQQLFWQEWMSMAFYPISSLEGDSTERIEGMRKLLSGVPVDRYGYVWQESDLVLDANSTVVHGQHRMGWPFPTSNNSEGMSTSWDFNGKDRTQWSSNVDAELLSGLFTATVENEASVQFVSPVPKSVDLISAYHAPLLEIDLRMYSAESDNIEDVYVWYTTEASPEWSEDKKVSVNEKAFIAYEYTPIYEHMIFLPMYAEEAWNSDKELTSYIRQIKVEIVPKEGKTLSGDFGLSYVHSAYDTRHSNNASLLISSLRKDYEYTNDIEYLKENITRARKAMNFYMQMYDTERCLNDQSYLVGHDSDRTAEFVGDQIAMTIANGYWDMSFMPKYDFHSNTYFYKALVDLAYLENILETRGVNVDKDLATVLTADRQFNRGTSDYTYDSADLNEIADDVLSALRKTINNTDHTGFWDEETGRFVAGYAEAEDKWYDYGYTMWNMEAIYYGIATEEQAKSIMDWISGKRIIEKDKNGSQGEDIYFFELAPRVNTYCSEDKDDVSIFTGMYSGKKGVTYGEVQLQNGGANMYTTFYDLMSRIQVYGSDDAFSRLKEIQTWYMDIYDWYVSSDNYNTHPDRFYWDYYQQSQWDSDGDGKGEYWPLQNSIKGGQERGDGVGIVGIDGEFLESILPIASIPYGFFGLTSIDGSMLQIDPNLPEQLGYWKTENLQFGGLKYDLTIFNNAIMINSVRGNARGLSVQVVLKAPENGEKVYINGKETNRYMIKEGNVYIAVPFKTVTVEVK